ncbi:MAG: hypothetical protein L7S56_03955 [Candidatus Poseidonia sp.]|nr:hypothetical protein [Poseidonia sp.]
MDLTIVGGEITIVARGGRGFALHLDVSAAIVTECGYFPENHRLSRQPACMETLEIAWRCRD